MTENPSIEQYPEIPVNASFVQTVLLENYTKEMGCTLGEDILASGTEYLAWTRVCNFLGDVILDTLEEDREKWKFSKMECYFWDRDSYYEKCSEGVNEYVYNLHIERGASGGYFHIFITPETLEHEEKLVNRLGELGLSEVIMVDEFKESYD